MARKRLTVAELRADQTQRARRVEPLIRGFFRQPVRDGRHARSPSLMAAMRYRHPGRHAPLLRLAHGIGGVGKVEGMPRLCVIRGHGDG